MSLFRRIPTEWFVLAAMLALALFSGAFTPVNSDLGWMLRMGRDISVGPAPKTNLYSFTEPHQPIVMVEWLFSWLTYQIHDRRGAAGLIAMKYVWIVVTVLGLYASLTRISRRPMLLLVVGLVATELMGTGFELTRAQLATLAGVALCTAAALDGRPLWLAVCVPVIALWANLHGGYAAGLAVLGALAVAQVIEQRQGWTPVKGTPAQLAAVLVAGALATGANPYDQRGLLEALALAGSPARLLDREWLPLYRFHDLLPGEIGVLVGLTVVTLLALLFLRRRQLKLWLLLLLAVGSSISASRHARMAPLLLGPVLLATLEDALANRAASLARIESTMRGLAATIAVVVGTLFAWRLPQALRGYLDYGGLPNPSRAIQVMRLNGIAGRIWNDFDWGGLLLWAVPDATVACDGRHVFAYSPEMISTNINFPSGEDPLAVLDRYQTELVLLPRDFPSLPRIETEYPVIYCDEDACLLSKRPEDLVKSKAGLLVSRVDLLPSDFFAAPRLPPLATAAVGTN